MRHTLSLTALSALALLAWARPSDSAPAPGDVKALVPTTPPAGGVRWIAATPDPMASQASARVFAAKGPAVEREAIAAMAVLRELEGRSTEGHVRGLLEAISIAKTLSEEVRGEAALMARSMAVDEGTPSGITTSRQLGLLTDVAVLGPFRDTGGGLAAQDGPEGPGGRFADAKADYSWGTFEVRWRAVPPAYSTADGVPLDLFVHPRKESCSWVASRIKLEKSEPVVVRVASSGQVRLMFDGIEVGKSEDVHEAARFDRLAARVDAKEGMHLVAAKVCSGALPDEGRVRLRVTTESGATRAVESSAELIDPPAAPKPAKPKTAGKAAPVKPTTALGRTLAASGDDVDALLAGAVARTLGGAEDLKSPRAPGMLDTITRTPNLDADRLALAAWIAPFGANRSGWLNLALARAETTKDEPARAFVLRRQVAEHLRAKMADWAMAALRGAKLTNEPDAEALLLRAKTNDALGSEPLRLASLHELLRAAQRQPSKVPNAVLEELFPVALAHDPKTAVVAVEGLAARGQLGRSYFQAMRRRSNKDALRAAEVVFGRGLRNAEDGISIAQDLGRMGEHKAALAAFSQMAAWAPNRAEAWAGLAEENAVAGQPARVEGQRSSPLAQTVAALKRARQLEPGEARYRAELALREPKSGSEGQASDERYLVPSQTILAKRLGAPAAGTTPDVADRELYWLRAVVGHADKRISQLIQYGREIVIAPRTQDELFENLPAEGDLTEILRARVHRKDGGTAFPVEEHNEGTRPRIRWPELLPGDVVEVAIRTWTSNPVGGRGDPPFYFLDYSGSTSTHPLLYNEVVVETSKAHPLYLDVLEPAWMAQQKERPAGKREEKDEGDRHITRLVWDRPLTIPEEPLSPQLSEIVPTIVGSSFKDWASFRTWYAEAVRGFTEPDAEVTRIAAELTKGKTTKQAKIKALFNFVADDIRYVNYVSGEWWLPNRPQQLLARREGDCDDKAILLITLLKSIGVEAQEVMVQTRETGQPALLRAKNAAVPMFDHGIAFLPGPGGGTYLDATSPQSRMGPVPAMDARAVALRMDSGPAEIVQLPASSPLDHGADVNWTISLKADGSGDLTGEEKHIGDGAFWLRTYLTQADARVQYVENNLVGGWFPTVQVDKKVEFNGEMENGQAWVKYSAHSEGLARHEARELVVPLSPSTTLASTLAPLLKRTLPVSLPSHLAPSRQRRTIRILAPAGHTWGELPPGGAVNGGDFGNASLEISKDPKDPRAVLVKRTVVFDRDQIPVDRYLAWRAFLQQVDALMHKSLRLDTGGAK
jgi:tetratricopeptide (TPR) repeat protein